MSTSEKRIQIRRIQRDVRIRMLTKYIDGPARIIFRDHYANQKMIIASKIVNIATPLNPYLAPQLVFNDYMGRWRVLSTSAILEVQFMDEH